MLCCLVAFTTASMVLVICNRSNSFSTSSRVGGAAAAFLASAAARLCAAASATLCWAKAEPTVMITSSKLAALNMSCAPLLFPSTVLFVARFCQLFRTRPNLDHALVHPFFLDGRSGPHPFLYHLRLLAQHLLSHRPAKEPDHLFHIGFGKVPPVDWDHGFHHLIHGHISDRIVDHSMQRLKLLGRRVRHSLTEASF